MPKARKIPYPGHPVVIDGSEAVAHIETRLAEACCAYPITPSTTMAALFQGAVADGRTNLWGTELAFLELDSEHSSASAAEGFALAGGRVTNFTAGQGLVLMKEVLYVISGKRLPIVFHVGARALTSQALNIHAGHDDVMGVADTGWGILFARNVQEVADLTVIARYVAEQTETPFLVVQGRLPDHAHTRKRAAPRGRAVARLRRRSARPDPGSVRPVRIVDDRRGPEPGLVHEGPSRAARLVRPPTRHVARCDDRMAADDRAELRIDRRITSPKTPTK
jgi:pyruvate/2-oxoacid:ferredoxin oxidoreductase alpha subunit